MQQAGIEPDAVIAPEVDETPGVGEPPRHFAERLARDKAHAVAVGATTSPSLVLAADTVVACGRRILGKTDDADRALYLLRLLSGRRHRVMTGVAVANGPETITVRSALTVVRFKRLTTAEMEAYLASEEWRGKAGAYAIQGRAEAFVTQINGSYSNVVGLPLELTMRMLKGMGWQPPWPG